MHKNPKGQVVFCVLSLAKQSRKALMAHTESLWGAVGCRLHSGSTHDRWLCCDLLHVRQTWHEKALSPIGSESWYMEARGQSSLDSPLERVTVVQGWSIGPPTKGSKIGKFYHRVLKRAPTSENILLITCLPQLLKHLPFLPTVVVIDYFTSWM